MITCEYCDKPLNRERLNFFHYLMKIVGLANGFPNITCSDECQQLLNNEKEINDAILPNLSL